MTPLNEFIATLAGLDIKLWADEGRIRCSAPEGAMTAELQSVISSRKAELLAFLEKAREPAAVQHDVPIAGLGEDSPLSPGQERIWKLAEMRPASSVYNISTAFRIKGDLDVPALEKSLDLIQRRHEILKTCFPLSESGVPQQTVALLVPFLLPTTDVFRDVRRLPEARQAREVKRFLLEEVRAPFDLRSGPLWRARLLKVKGRPTSWWRSRLQWYKQAEYVLSVTMHHIIFDGASKHIFLNELTEAYSAYTAGRNPDLPELTIQYVDFSRWQRRWVTGPDARRQLEYWRRKFSSGVPELRVPVDRPRASTTQSSGDYVEFSLPRELAASITTYCQQQRVSQYAVLLSAFFCLLRGYNQQDRFVVCSPLASRTQVELERLIGYFNNVLPMLAELGGDLHFRDVVDRVKRVVVEALENSNTPLQEISDLPQLARTPLSRAMFSLQDTSTRKLNLSDLETSPVDVRKEAADFDLAMYMEIEGGVLGGVLEFNADLFEAASIGKMVRNYQEVLERALGDPSVTLAKLPRFGMSAEDVARILEAHPKIDQAVIAGIRGGSGLAAYMVLNEYDVPEIDEIRAYARESLPAYLVPSAFLPLDQIPVDETGCVDFGALPNPGHAGRVGGKPYVAPRTELEQRLADIWKKVLWLDEEIGVEDNFHELGGHSLLSVQLVLAIEKELGRRLPERAIAQLGTISELVASLDSPADPELKDDATTHSGLGKTAIPAGVLHELRSYTASWQGARVAEDSIAVGLNTDGEKQALFWCLQRYGELTQLAKYLGADQPVYGLRSGNRVMVKTPENIRVLAEYYANEVLAVQPKGPFLLGGNCQAAKIAFQIADTLRGWGHEITLLILHEKFIPELYPGRVSLIFGAGSIFNPYQFFVAPEKGWAKYYSGGFTVDVVPGTHGKFFREPNVQPLCHKIKQRVEEAQGSRKCDDAQMGARAESRLSANAYRAKLSAGQRLAGQPGSEATIDVEVENVSSELWPMSEKSGVFVSSRWLNAKGKVVESLGPRVPIVRDLAPGESIQIELPIRCPKRIGEWDLEIDVVDEGVAWFGDYGSATVHIKVEVGGGSAMLSRVAKAWNAFESKILG